MNFNELNNDQRRQWIDLTHVFEAYEQTSSLMKHSFNGSMRWLERGGKDYLHRKSGITEKSLGPRSSKTEKIYQSFFEGRQKTREKLNTLSSKLTKMAPVNRALNLGRVPELTSRILRKLAQEELLGDHILVIGTNALWAYEAKTGLQLASELLATTDADLLMDARKNISLLAESTRQEGLIGILKKVDRSFERRSERDFKAVNNEGFSVDLIQPEDFDAQLSGKARKTIGTNPENLHGAPIFGLHWLQNSPRFTSMVVGEDGFPLRLTTVDPRAFALHKIWISDSVKRDPLKRKRDLRQAEAVIQMVKHYLALEFDPTELQALPAKLRGFIK